MIKVTVYLGLFVGVLVLASISLMALILPAWLIPLKLFFACILAGGYGGAVYCLRAIYLNACVHKRWDKDWLPWYFIRPIVSLMVGGVSYIFLKGGLLVLEASTSDGSSHFGFLAVAFIAGLNVDRFLAKIEEITQSVWGIEKSRAGKTNSERKDH